MTSAKNIYDRRKRLKNERLLREEESAALHRENEDENEILLASIATSFERIADALEQISRSYE